MIPLEKWINSKEVLFYKKLSIQQILGLYSHRSPTRAVFRDSKAFFTPCDGTVLHVKEVNPLDCSLEKQGKQYCLEELLSRQLVNRSYFVIGLFMSFYNVPVIRVPSDSFLLSISYLKPVSLLRTSFRGVKSGNEKEGVIKSSEESYLRQRVVYEFVDSKGFVYWILIITDYEKDSVFTLSESKSFLFQGQPFAKVLLASRVEVIVPKIETLKVNLGLRELCCVRSPEDKLMSWGRF